MTAQGVPVMFELDVPLSEDGAMLNMIFFGGINSWRGGRFCAAAPIPLEHAKEPSAVSQNPALQTRRRSATPRPCY